MTILAKPSNKVPIIRVNDREKFVEAFNNSMPSKELLESCEKAGEFFGPKNNVTSIDSDMRPMWLLLKYIHMNYDK